MFGDAVDAVAQTAIAQGADKVYAVTNPLLAQFQVELILAAAETLCRETGPAIILVARTNQGREVAPRLAFRLGVGLAQDCLEVSVDTSSGKLLANRPVYGGNAVAVISCNQTPQVAAVRPKVYVPLEPDSARQGEVISFPVDLDDSMVRSRVIEVVKEEAEGVKLEDASIVVSGGRGLGGPEPFAQLEELARAAGRRRWGFPGGRRFRWVPASYQVGLTGKTITPDLYITIAISAQPATGRLLRVQGHRRHQQGRRGQHLQGGPLRRGRRLGNGAGIYDRNGGGNWCRSRPSPVQ